MVIQFQQFSVYPALKGFFVGGCIERGEGSSFRAKAHAHRSDTDKFKGWVCIRSIKRVYMIDGIRPSNLILHELAHILLPHKHWHDDTWMLKVNELGGNIDKQYKRTKNYRKYIKQKRL